MKPFAGIVSTCALLSLLAASGRAAEPQTYVGSGKCRPCHLKEHASWSETRMARAFDLLKPGAARNAKVKAKLDPDRDYTKDSACVACHTTGYGKPGGFASLAATPGLAGVGCESCHGAGGGYVGPMAKKGYRKAALVSLGLVDKVSKEQCAACHNTDCPVGVVVGSRRFVREMRFDTGRLKGSHEKLPLKHPH